MTCRVVSVAFLMIYPFSAFSQEGKEDRPAKRRIVVRDGKAVVEGADGHEVKVEVRDRDGRRMPVVFGRGARSIVKPSRPNVVDRARFDIAEMLVEKHEYDEAAHVLQKIVEGSPDPTAVSAAHLSIGNIRRQHLNDVEGAVAAYKRVTTGYDHLAENYIAATYRETDKPLTAVKVLEDLLKTAETPQRKARLLELIARLYQEQNEIDLAIETYRRIPACITYEEAMAMRGTGAGRGAVAQPFRMDLPRGRLRRRAERRDDGPE